MGVWWDWFWYGGDMPKRKGDYPSHGGNTNLEERLCALACTVEAQGKKIDRLIKSITRGEKTMATIAEQLAELRATIAQVKVDLADEKTEVAAAIQALKDQIGSGTPVTAADLDELITSVKDIGAGVKDIFIPPTA